MIAATHKINTLSGTMIHGLIDPPADIVCTPFHKTNGRLNIAATQAMRAALLISVSQKVSTFGQGITPILAEYVPISPSG
jgi:hypothetical protein